MLKISPKPTKTTSAENYMELGNGGGQEKQRVSVNKTPRMNMAILSLPPPQGFVFLEDKVSFFLPLVPCIF